MRRIQNKYCENANTTKSTADYMQEAIQKVKAMQAAFYDKAARMFGITVSDIFICA